MEFFNLASSIVSEVRKNLISVPVVLRPDTETEIQFFAQVESTSSEKTPFINYGLYENSAIFVCDAVDLFSDNLPPKRGDVISVQETDYVVSPSGTGPCWWRHPSDPTGQTICIHVRSERSV